MAQRPVIKAEARTEFGKGVARRLRREWKVPGVIYGSHQEPVHFAVPLLDIQSLVRNNGVNAVLELEIDGEQYLTMVKHVDQNVLTFDIDHVDLLAIKRGEKVEVEVPVTLTGEPAPGTMHIQDADVLLVEADVLNIPEEIEVSIEGLEDGAVITAADVTMPEDTTLVAEEDTVIVSISLPEVDEELEEAAEAAEEGGADAGAESVDEGAESSDSKE
ncbi:50S ribosomal protein L25/general stress protein Ctc [Corynebacterium marquesiae]|uniref:50S ribosomal protein L25/general stress protein Ctc n=1 Tax=Corynebacterium marquesiae TaxID=2913503 RepID=UPI001EF40A94|nr:50S ribosomal protein L25/general stress protein Ctc [Corynebacterium marquesiae]MCG7447957.1 50S ribosomal protein L25/general stress protein Ctc [Corynebacterium aurimucosum]MCZ9300172.1 50S ribosomal protein L25/general stress protein Ctc [Corynebacterium marquesiae]MDK8454798.1 50S ribosomal protein L25/general stress protein Ctc [Corynebacterium marquesiae]MDK8479947.1 50S ribosomal protein L25/general stress protein Ctc [Corynebacterium marquesiae]MDK8530578.1 50S ribosomal protein L2